MRCVVHDYAGHPFQACLSRHLARRGHEVTHLYFSDNPGPKGTMTNQPTDPRTLQFLGIGMGGPLKHAAGTGAQIGFARRLGDVAYGRKAAEIVRRLRPDVVLSANTPSDAQDAIIRVCKAEKIRFVYWLQDIYSLAVSRLLSDRLGFLGRAIGMYYRRLERRQLRASDAVVVISEDFVRVAASWAGNPAKVSIIENWGPIEDIPVGTKDNAWSREHGLHTGFAFVYSGTLGRKHNHSLLLKLANDCTEAESVVVVAQGFGVPCLQEAKAKWRLGAALKLLPIQPAERLSALLATADVLVGTIGRDAATFAVPSKVLSYLCASRPILLAAPRTNLAARIVEQANAGIVVEPDDEKGFLSAAARLRGDQNLRKEFGTNGRAYAERVFNMRTITNRFESVLRR